jgi:uncharacterized integral membrane protein
MKTSPYKGRRASLVRNFWIYRRLVALACVLGLMLWFIWANDTTVKVSFPFGLGVWTSTTGLVILLSALCGSVVTALSITLVYAWRRVRGGAGAARPEEEVATPLADERPPADYAAKTTEGFPESRWS